MAQVHTFFYIQLEPTSIHLLQVDGRRSRMGDVRLLTSEDDNGEIFGDSDWHGVHSFYNVGCEEWSATFQFPGEDASLMRVVNFSSHLHLTNKLRTWWGHHAGRRWCYIVRLSSQCTEAINVWFLLHVPHVPRILFPPPPLPSVQESTTGRDRSDDGGDQHGQPTEERVFDILFRAAMGMSPRRGLLPRTSSESG